MKRKPEPPPEPDLLTASDVARKLSVGPRTLWRMVARGEVPAPIRYNRKLVRWKRVEIEAYIDELSNGSSPGHAE